MISGINYSKPIFENVVFPIQFSHSKFKSHPQVIELSKELLLDNFYGKIVLVSKKNMKKSDEQEYYNYDNWEFFDVTYGVPLDNDEDNDDCIKSMPYLFNKERDVMWNTTTNIFQVYFRFLEKNGFDFNTLNEESNSGNEMKLYPSQTIVFEKD